MLSYAIKRIALSLLICAVSMVMLLAMIRSIPGNAATIILGSRATPEMVARFNSEMGLDQPFYKQVGIWFGKLLTGDLGNDLWSKKPVSTIIVEVLPQTLTLIFVAIGWAALLGILLGCYSALRPGTWIDRIVSVFAVGTISIPPFVLSIYLLMAFAVRLGWFPVLGAGQAGNIWDQVWHLVLPAFAIGLGWTGYLARLVRGSMLEVIEENHVRTARSIGLPEWRITLNYALRLAIIPTVTMLGVSIGSLLSSTVLVENVFARPGLGLLIADAAKGRNYPVVQGAVFTSVLLFAIAMPIADLIVAWLDPRVRDTL